jgi:peptidoglycan/LPS O-acetylase OafA/YrhL
VTRLGHVSGLDGIRGLAILAVLGHHFLGLRGGFYGVDLFFVLSGFLITTLLLEEHAATGFVSLRRFYERRARRLLPALGPVLLFSLLVAVLEAEAGHGDNARVRIEGIVSCIFYAANVVATFGNRLPIELSHMWSLAQEEQFYLLWPTILILLLYRARVSPVRLAALLAACAVVAMTWRGFVALHGGSEDRVLYAPDTHCDGLLLGAALAAARAAGLKSAMHRTVKRLIIPAGLLLLIAAVLLPPTRLGFTVGGPAVELAAVAFILGAIGDHPRLLRWSPLVWLGSISYGVYLWQGPLLLLFGHSVFAPPLAVVLAYASARYIEAPFRHRPMSAPKDGRQTPSLASSEAIDLARA